MTAASGRSGGIRGALVLAVLALAASLLPATASHAEPPAEAADERPAPPDRAAPYAPDELIVKWAPGSSANARAQARQDQSLRKVDDLEIIGAEVVEIPGGQSPAVAAARVNADPRVEYAEPNLVLRSHQAPDDPLFGQLWGLRNTGQPVQGIPGQPGVDIDVLPAWEQTRGDEDLVVAVIDTGVDLNHPDLAANIWQNPDPGSDPRYPDDFHGWDFFNDDNTVFDLDEGESHGTHVAGTIAAVADNAVGVAGVAPGVQVMPLKFLGPGGTGFLSDAVRAIQYASERGVTIANASWGSPAFSQSLRNAIAASGMLLVVAAGNNGHDLDGAEADYPCSFDLGNVLCVAAVTNMGGLASFSNFGRTTVDVGAPGRAVLSTVPAAPGAEVALQITDPGGGYRAMLWGFSFWDVVGANARRDLLTGALRDHLGLAQDDAILLVDDDESADPNYADARPTYQQALSAGGFTDVAVHDVPPDANGPPAATMAAHDAVVWFTGQAFGSSSLPTLTSQDRSALMTFLDGGGRLLLAGQDALWRIENSALVTDYLHAVVVDEVEGRPDGQGGAGSVYDGQTYDLTGVEGPSQAPSRYLKHITPRRAAATVALSFRQLPYDDAYAYLQGTSMAAPHATGIAALLASVQPELTPEDLVTRIRETVTPLASLAGTTIAGGMVNAAAALGAPPAQAPSAPRSVTATAGDGQAAVSWLAPTTDGGAPVTGYTVTASPGGATATVGGNTLQATVTGLTNDTAYTFTVTASNAAGTSPPSAPSAPVTPTAEAATACEGRQVPRPGFTDITGNPHEAAIDCLVWYGLAQGTSPDTYAPRATVTRAQMASFVARTIEAAGGTLPAGQAQFTDVAGNTHQANIERLAAAGIVQGVGSSRYAPRATVTRAQMASFLARTFEFVHGSPLPVAPAPFTDIAGNTHADNIRRVAGAGFARGTTATTYSPASGVRRDQMASFLSRMLERFAADGRISPPAG